MGADPEKASVRSRLLGLVPGGTSPSILRGAPVVVLCVAVETLVAYLLTRVAPVQTVNMVYLPGILVVGSMWGLGYALAMALISAMAFDYFLVPPLWSLRPTKITDVTVPAIFLTVALLVCFFSSLVRSLAVELNARQEADLTAELARLLLRGPDLPTALAAAARHLERALGLPSAAIQVGEVAADEQHQALVLDDGESPATLIVPAGLPQPTLRRLRERVLPSLAILLQAARDRECSADALKASRARIVAAADATRRRIERDLHDGTQQRLVSIIFKLRALHAAVPSGANDFSRELDETTQALDETLTDLQEISRGLHPPILAKGGLEPALTALARRSPVAVDLRMSTRGRLPEHLETTIYYVASEALTNIAKHSHATAVRIELTGNTVVRLVISDDGIGGAEPSHGSGLTGLADRVEALEGTMTLLSPVGHGTELTVTLPTDRTR